MDNSRYSIFMSLMTFYALFFDDLRVWVLSSQMDNIFYSLSLLAMLAFGFELFIFSYCKTGYYLGFYFWLDMLATVTLITDVGFIWNPLLAAALGDDSAGTTSNEAIAAIRASRVGTKSSRIVRIVRIVRLVRVVKLYKVAKGSEEVEDAVADENPSLVGKKLGDKTMQRVISIVLSMLVFVQFFDVGMYTTSVTRGTDMLHRLHRNFLVGPATVARNDSAARRLWFEADFREEVQDFVYGLELKKLICIQLYSGMEAEYTWGGLTAANRSSSVVEFARNTKWSTWNAVTNKVDVTTANAATQYNPSQEIRSVDEIKNVFRNTEYDVASASDCYDPDTRLVSSLTNCTSYAYFDISSAVRTAALLNILQTIFVMIVLTAGSALLANDAERLVIRPIDKMVKSVKQLAENPMSAGAVDAGTGGDDDDETMLLQRTIAKIGALLMIGFGEAGSEIIAVNMSNNAGIEPMCDGVKVTAAFGFCDIRNFTDTTECLQEKVMVYVNKVGSIVHEATHKWYGAANKNIGDAFLLVWKVGKKSQIKATEAEMCNSGLIAFLKAMIDLKRENGPGGCLHEYKENQAIRKRFGDNKFEIKLGMGLHIGWAIEGTIGSKYKIDASYLSPNVNMAARLEAATKQFRTPLLLSEDFYDRLSSQARKRCRQIDKVTVKGSLQPMGLFTCDIVNFIPHFAEPEVLSDGTRAPFDFDGQEMNAVQAGLPDGFFDKCKDAMQLYLAGDWELCKQQLEEILVTKPEDGPTVSLLAVLEGYGYKAPENWKGFRELTEK